MVRLVLFSVPYALGHVQNSNYVIHQLADVYLTVVIISHLSSLMDLSHISFCHWIIIAEIVMSVLHFALCSMYVPITVL
jgi:hypothetical protein